MGWGRGATRVWARALVRVCSGGLAEAARLIGECLQSEAAADSDSDAADSDSEVEGADSDGDPFHPRRAPGAPLPLGGGVPQHPGALLPFPSGRGPLPF